METHEAWLALARAPGMHADLLRPCAALLADPTALLGASTTQLRDLGFPPAAVAWLTAPDPAVIAADLHWADHAGIAVIGYGTPAYPPLLAECPSAPLALYVRGDSAALLSVQIAMVGTRHPTVSGRRTAGEFAAAFARAGLTITSGLALGIDAASHAGAMSCGRTIAVLGTGLDDCYPPENRGLAERLVAAGGALVSEFPPGTAPHKGNFPRRNRLISGLALGTLVVEAARRSGSLITARLAGTQGREVFAIPGSIHSPQSHGCHELIRQGARLVESAPEVLQELAIPYGKQIVMPVPEGAAVTDSAAPPLDNDQKILLDALGFEPTSIDALVDRTGLPSQSLASMLLILELEGRVGLHPGGRYIRHR